MSNTKPHQSPGNPLNENTLLPIATGLILRRVREEKELTQAELAIRTDMNLSYISNVENGQSNISIVKLDIFCKGLEIQPGSVLSLAQGLIGPLQSVIRYRTAREADRFIRFHLPSLLNVEPIVLQGRVDAQLPPANLKQLERDAKRHLSEPSPGF